MKALYVLTAQHERIFVELVPEDFSVETWLSYLEDLFDTAGIIGVEEESVGEN
jgi:hypothetical protein